MAGLLYGDLRTFMKIIRWILPRMKKVADENCMEN
jgi:hypothetical protein